jgi:bifunctional non-homologous end joining protein LigD
MVRSPDAASRSTLCMPSKHQIQVEGRELTISNLDKVYFPGSGFTKGEVIKFYTDIADVIVPHLQDRPLTLKRYPEGVEREHFYEKNAPSHTPSWVKRFAVPRSEGGSPINYILCNDSATLIWVTNLGDIEKHVLLARVPDLNRPTSIVFDLDPGEPADLVDCGRVALHLRKVLEALGLKSFVKVSGSKGLHLSVPLNSDVTYEMTQPFAKSVAELARQEAPDQIVSDMSKALRRGKVLIDWSQNSDFKTTVAVYAMRARPAGPFISMPITWAELEKAVKRRDRDMLYFAPDAAVKRLARMGDLFEPVLTLKQILPSAFTEALAANPPPRLSTWQRHRRTSAANRDRSLREYAAKRNPARTPEPVAHQAGSRAREGVHRFVIQKHQARRLHYDFRLEMQGVLRSWAVPKGPPTQPREARLAMHVEDHPIEYENFEGTIPAGNYGAGTVMVWDHGEYEDLTGDPETAFAAGKLHMVLRGTKLNGEWILVKDKRDDEGHRWLLIKAGEAMSHITPDIDDRSAITGRTMAEITEANDAQWQSNRPAATRDQPPRAALPRVEADFIEPMQCKPVTKLPEEEGWMFEIKFDGYRCIAVKTGSTVKLYSRRENTLNDRFPDVVAALEGFKGDFVMDGEIVAADEQGRPSFQLLQNSSLRKHPIYFHAFDLLNRDGRDLRDSPIERRRQNLNELLAEATDPIRVSPLLDAPGGQVLKAVQELGLEGVIGKRTGSLYESGKRSGAWIKHRTNRRQEFVIGGYVPGAHGFDALLVGVYETRHLVYVAKVRNGFLARHRKEILPQLKKLAIPECPFANLPEKKSSRWGESLTAEKMQECRWVRPKLVCEVAFVEWTDGGKLRHCSFIAMRDDKKASAVVRET